jgi:putative two-component system response regulator
MAQPTMPDAPVLIIPDADSEEVFVVDDDRTALDGIGRLLERAGYTPKAFTSPVEALGEIRPGRPRVLVTDNDMPGMTGLELAEKAMEIDPEIRVIVATGAGGEKIAQAALRLGSTDYLVKPVEFAELLRAVQKAVMAHATAEFTQATDAWLREEVRRQTARVREVTLGALEALVHALEARSPHFAGHSQSVATCAEEIARALGLGPDEVSSIRTAGLLHDIGMIGVPDSIIAKPGQLDPQEYAAVMAHCRSGADILEPMTHLGPAITFVLEHHERLDGGGYPDRKKGAAISLGGQIVGLAEAWTALTEGRSYRDRMSHADAMGTLAATGGKWFAPELLEALRTSRRRS